MNMKNVIKRAGVIFILGPAFIFCIILNLIMWSLVIIWGPIYYIVTGNDPLEIDTLFNWSYNFADWYIKKFGPK